jgi:hypothetical protein
MRDCDSWRISWISFSAEGACNTTPHRAKHASFGRSDRVLRADHATRQGQSNDEVTDNSERSYSATPPAREPNFPANTQPAVVFDPESGNLRLGRSSMVTGINLYFKYCHRQPIWCFEREELGDYGSIPEELACSILALTSRFLQKGDHVQLYGNNAKTLIMLRIANGTVDLTTIESLCLLSYSSFIGMR